jgi:hypothetical protein
MQKFAKWAAPTLGLVAYLMAAQSAAVAGPSIGIVASDSTNVADVAATLQATGDFSSVTIITGSADSSTPTLSQLQGYNSILAWTNFPPADATALGNVLAQYVNGGGGLVLSTYAFSNPWAIGGTIATTGYSPLTNVGVNGDVSGNLVATVPGDPIFNGVDLNALGYYHNGNYAQPGLDAGATLLATDGAGVNMIARNAAGNIIANNIYPGNGTLSGDQDAANLFANELMNVAGTGALPTPEPSTICMAGTGALFALGVAVRRQRQPAV